MVVAYEFEVISDEALTRALVDTELESREKGESVLDMPYEYLATFNWFSDDLDIPWPGRALEVIVQQCGWITPEFQLDVNLFDLIEEFQHDRGAHYLVERYIDPYLVHSPEIDVLVRERCREAVARAKEQLGSARSRTYSYTWHPPVPPLAIPPTEKTLFEYSPSKDGWAPGRRIG